VIELVRSSLYRDLFHHVNSQDLAGGHCPPYYFALHGYLKIACTNNLSSGDAHNAHDDLPAGIDRDAHSALDGIQHVCHDDDRA
jgi:hypothetical protein